MAEEVGSKIFQLYHFAYSLIFCRSLQEIYQLACEALAKSVEAKNAVLWQFSAQEARFFPIHSYLENKSTKTRNVQIGSDYLGEVFRSGKPMFLTSQDLKQPSRHIQFPREMVLASGLCIPFKGQTELEGVLELINKEDGVSAFTDEDAVHLSKALQVVTVAVGNMKSYEERFSNQLNAITRLTLLYDIGQIFNSTLELDQLLPIICEKIRDIMEAATCTIWFLDDSEESMRFGFSVGEYEEAFSSYASKLEDDPAGEVMQKGEGILLENATGEERLQKRFPNAEEETAVTTYIAAPLECKGQILGTLEVVDRLNEKAYNEEDQFLLNDLSHQAAVAIHNANLLQTERKAKELDALLSISREITSTLNLDRVLLTIVNQAASLVPYDRAALALIDRSRVDLAAVSGKMEVDKNNPEMRELQEILTWSSHLEKGLYISEFEGQIATDREENRQKFKTHFEKTGFKSFVSMPLTDEEGKLGILSFESATPYFLDERHLEVLTILANQATVAIRNAQLYRQVPLLNLMEPIMQRQAKWRKMSQRRKAAWLTIPGVALALLIFAPWRMDIVGDATILPTKRTPVVTQVEGIVKNVYGREGAQVRKNTVIASILDNDYKLALEESRTRHDLLAKQIRQNESLGDSAAARQQRIQLEQVARDIQFQEYLLKNTSLTAPIDGVILTPRIEEKTGSLLKKGEEFCEMADMRNARALIDIEEGDTAYLKEGQQVRLKLNAFPTRKFYGIVKRLGAELQERDSSRYFRIEAQIQSANPVLKSGMVGKAKVDAGYRSIGYVLLRKPFRFIWKKLWVWAP